MGVEKYEDFGVQFMPSCLNWKFGGAKALSEDSLYINPLATGWNYYAYSTRTLTLKYSDLIGKRVIVDFDIVSPGNNLIYVSLGTLADPNFSGGVSGQSNRKNIYSSSTRTNHFHWEGVIGTDYTSTNTSYYLALSVFAYNPTSDYGPVTVTNIKCGYKQEDY